MTVELKDFEWERLDRILKYAQRRCREDAAMCRGSGMITNEGKYLMRHHEIEDLIEVFRVAALGH